MVALLAAVSSVVGAFEWLSAKNVPLSGSASSVVSWWSAISWQTWAIIALSTLVICCAFVAGWTVVAAEDRAKKEIEEMRASIPIRVQAELDRSKRDARGETSQSSAVRKTALESLCACGRAIAMHLDTFPVVEVTRDVVKWQPWMDTAKRLIVEARTIVADAAFPSDARLVFLSPRGKARVQAGGEPIAHSQRVLSQVELGIKEAVAMLITPASITTPAVEDTIDASVNLLRAKCIEVPDVKGVGYTYFNALLTASGILLEGASRSQILEALAPNGSHPSIRKAVSEALTDVLREWQLMSFVTLVDRGTKPARPLSAGVTSKIYRLLGEGKEAVRRSKQRHSHEARL